MAIQSDFGMVQPVKYDDTWWNMMKYGEIWWNMVKYGEIWWNMMKYYEIWWNMVKHGELHPVTIVLSVAQHGVAVPLRCPSPSASQRNRSCKGGICGKWWHPEAVSYAKFCLMLIFIATCCIAHPVAVSKHLIHSIWFNLANVLLSSSICNYPMYSHTSSKAPPEAPGILAQLKASGWMGSV